LLVLLFILIPVLGFIGVVMPGPLEQPTTVVVPRGASVHDIGVLLDINGVVYSHRLFPVAARAIAYGSLQAGEYQFTSGQSIADIVLMMHEGHSVVRRFTVAEGLTSADIIAAMKANTALTGDVPVPSEGSILPETYRYSYGDSRADLIARMQKAMQDALNELWLQRDAAVPLKSPQEAVIMASVIEKETGKAAERPRIAGVFYNRLRQNMRLQSDPTVIYAITQAKGPMDHDLGHDDLSFTSPINTYASDGLPSQPICNPGRASLEAALHPETNDFLFFVADGTGGHVFAHTLAEHNQNVTKWNELKAKTP
jgi:UPF0755 protein